MYVILDSTTREELRVITCNKKGKLKEYHKKITFHESEKLLLFLKTILQKNKITFHKVWGIAVVLGPGESFTALRNSVVIANALAWGLQIPNIGIKRQEFKNTKELLTKGMNRLKKRKTPEILLPFYGKEPHITKKKK